MTSVDTWSVTKTKPIFCPLIQCQRENEYHEHKMNYDVRVSLTMGLFKYNLRYFLLTHNTIFKY